MVNITVQQFQPSEIIAIFNEILAHQNNQASGKLVCIRGLYLKGNGIAYNGIYFDSLRDENSQVELPIKITDSQRKELTPGNLVDILGTLGRRITPKSEIKLELNVSRIEVVKEQVRLFRWIAQYATMSSFGLFTEKQQTVYREMMSMGDSEYVAKKLGITRSRVIDIFLNCLKIIAQTINLKKDKEKWEKLEKENQQLKFLTATLRQELEDLKDSKPVEPKKFKTEEELLNGKLNTSIYNFAFSIRAIHVLEGVGCKTLGDVKNLQKGDLRNIPNCGLKTIKDIEEVLEANGLSLKDIES